MTNNNFIIFILSCLKLFSQWMVSMIIGQTRPGSLFLSGLTHPGSLFLSGQTCPENLFLSGWMYPFLAVWFSVQCSGQMTT